MKAGMAAMDAPTERISAARNDTRGRNKRGGCHGKQARTEKALGNHAAPLSGLVPLERCRPHAPIGSYRIV